jgi:hypothetical protein
MNEIVPAEKTIAALVDANNPAAKSQVNSIEDAARKLGRKVRWSRLSEQFLRIDKWSVCRG